MHACELRCEQFNDVLARTAELVKRPRRFHFQQGICAGVDDPGLRIRDTARYVRARGQNICRRIIKRVSVIGDGAFVWRDRVWTRGRIADSQRAREALRDSRSEE